MCRVRPVNSQYLLPREPSSLAPQCWPVAAPQCNPTRLTNHLGSAQSVSAETQQTRQASSRWLNFCDCLQFHSRVPPRARWGLKRPLQHGPRPFRCPPGRGRTCFQVRWLDTVAIFVRLNHGLVLLSSSFFCHSGLPTTYGHAGWPPCLEHTVVLFIRSSTRIRRVIPII